MIVAPVMAQTYTVVNTDFGNVYGSLAALVAAIPVVVEIIKKFLPKLPSWSIQLISWIVGIGVTMAGAAVASIIAMLAAIPKPKKLASGALAYSTALVQVGEYAGAGHNPEVIAPLDKIRSMINPQQSMNNMNQQVHIHTLLHYITRC